MSIAVTPAWARDIEAYPSRKTEDIQWVVAHRIQVSQEDPGFADTPAEIERFFAEHPTGAAATGGRMPYAILIDPMGGVTQTVPLIRVTPHVRHYNLGAVGIGCIGDFRGRPPAAEQRQVLVQVCADLLARFALDTAALVGHDELSGASADPTKECPGAGLAMDALRCDVAAATIQRLELV